MKCPICELLYVGGSYNHRTQNTLWNHLSTQHPKYQVIRFVEQRFNLSETANMAVRLSHKYEILDWLAEKLNIENPYKTKA